MNEVAGQLDPNAMTPEQLGRLLSAAGGRPIDPQVIREHVVRGAPTAADGRLNLLHYVAWLVREVATGGVRGN